MPKLTFQRCVRFGVQGIGVLLGLFSVLVLLLSVGGTVMAIQDGEWGS